MADYGLLLFQYIFEEHFQKMTGGKSVFTGLKATTHFGRPQMNKIMTAVHKAHPMVSSVFIIIIIISFYIALFFTLVCPKGVSYWGDPVWSRRR